MAELYKFDAGQPARRPECVACEEMLTDAVDGLLSEVDQAWFDRHVAGCVDCNAALADAQRGAAWLELLKAPRPEPSAQLLERILAQTSGAPEMTPFVEPFAAPFGEPFATPFVVPVTRKVLPFRPPMPAWNRIGRIMLEPRLAMTAAMAFFSIALTMNLTGVRIDQMHASNLEPSNLKRSYYQAKASAARHYEGLRVVHVMEARVDTLRTNVRDADDAPRLPESRRDRQPKTSLPTDNGAQPDDKKKDDKVPRGVSRNDKPGTVPRLLLTDETLRYGHNSATSPLAGKQTATRNERGGLA